MVEYRIKAELHRRSLLHWYIAFGIQAYGNDHVQVYIPDVFCRKRDAVRFVDICNRSELDIIHLKDVIEDYI
ncbi:MAG: hypothetical protein IKV35_01130 [Clostridia bacterium]|nr:hypothetical protein [Clostridia bacterium]